LPRPLVVLATALACGDPSGFDTTIRVVDLAAPTVTAELPPGRVPGAWTSDPLFVRGDSIAIRVLAQDNRRLAWGNKSGGY
jgi:hypothetical protein